mgnify:CR=1 FL=1
MPRSDRTEYQGIYPVPSSNIPNVWRQIKQGLDVVKSRACSDWTFELVKSRLMASEAFLFLAPEGFFILMPRYTSEPSVLIWIAYSVGRSAIPHYLPTVERLAREIGAKNLEIESDRPGYQRVFRDWQRTGNKYIRRLT